MPNNNAEPIILPADDEPEPTLDINDSLPETDQPMSHQPSNSRHHAFIASWLMDPSQPTTYVYDPNQADIDHTPTRET